jgi:hypothetical protein
MQIEAREILFLRQNAPRWLFGQVAKNVNKPLNRVKYQFYGLPNNYDEDIIIEARRILKEVVGIVYNPDEVIDDKHS